MPIQKFAPLNYHFNNHHHHKYAHPLIVRVFAFLLALTISLQNVLYPWISILPAPPPIKAQEASPPPATLSAQTPAPSPLDPLLNLEEIFSSTDSTQLDSPEAIPEPPLSTPSATPSATTIPSPSPTPSASAIAVASPDPTPTPSFSPEPSPPKPEIKIPRVLDPIELSLTPPFRGNYPISYRFGENSDSPFVSRLQSLFGVIAHDGVDYAMPEDTPVLAVDKGTVILAGAGDYGTTIILEHSWGRSRSMSEQALSILAQSSYHDGLVAGVDHTIEVAHKYGVRHGNDNIEQLHDCGIVYYPDHPYLLCLMTKGTDFPTLTNTLASLSRTVYSGIKARYPQQ